MAHPALANGAAAATAVNGAAPANGASAAADAVAALAVGPAPDVTDSARVPDEDEDREERKGGRAVWLIIATVLGVCLVGIAAMVFLGPNR
jgi:hypothetical protein